jgi:uncharacterized protein YraI
MIPKPLGLRFYAVVFAGLFSGLAAAQQVTISRDANLQAEPKTGAAVVAEVKQGATAEVLAKQGAWVQVKSAAGTGWLFSFNVNYGSGGPAAASGRTAPRSASTSTIGIRGLDEEEMKAAKFDGAQLDALDAFSSGNPDESRGAAPKGRKK